MAYTYCYDPELDLWAIMDSDGYVVDYEVLEIEAQANCIARNSKEAQ